VFSSPQFLVTVPKVPFGEDTLRYLLEDTFRYLLPGGVWPEMSPNYKSSMYVLAFLWLFFEIQKSINFLMNFGEPKWIPNPPKNHPKSIFEAIQKPYPKK